MSARFWLVAAMHHAVVLLAIAFAARILSRRSRESRAGASLLGLLAVVAGLGLVATTSAWIASAALPDRIFGFGRLVVQVAFGEVPVLLGGACLVFARRGRRCAAILCASVCALVLGVYVFAYHVEPARLVVRRHEVDVAGLAAPLRIVHISDIQAHRPGPRERRVLREAMRQAPDLILLTGDYMQSRGGPIRPVDAEALRQLVREESLAAPLGIFAVWGNTDRNNRALFGGLPIRVLENEVARVGLAGGGTLAIVGLNWTTSMSPGPGELSRLFRQVRSDDHVIVLGHAPDFASELVARHRADLILAGHTHGGQVALPLLGPPMTMSRAPRSGAAGGLREVGGVPVNVSRGAGLERGSAPQIRFLCPPELSVLDLVAVPRTATRPGIRPGS